MSGAEKPIEDPDRIAIARGWYDRDYKAHGMGAQRSYPNEEFLRFMGRNYFHRARADRPSLRILEVGCGSCANLWMVAQEGFGAYGLDVSREALALGARRLAEKGAGASLVLGSMTALPFRDQSFDAVCDVFSAHCLPMAEFSLFLAEARRVLRPGARLFLYTPTDRSDAFLRHEPARKIDAMTLDGVRRADAPFAGNLYPFRFSNLDWLRRRLDESGFEVAYIETVTRTYNGLREDFQHATVEAVRRG